MRRRGGVDLGDRRGGQRLAVEPAEHRLERAAEVLLDDPAHVGERLGAAPGRGSVLNSSTSSSGKIPSPEEMIWPSLM